MSKSQKKMRWSLIKRNSNIGDCCEFCTPFKNIYFEKILRMGAYNNNLFHENKQLEPQEQEKTPVNICTCSNKSDFVFTFHSTMFPRDLY